MTLCERGKELPSRRTRQSNFALFRRRSRRTRIIIIIRLYCPKIMLIRLLRKSGILRYGQQRKNSKVRTNISCTPVDRASVKCPRSKFAIYYGMYTRSVCTVMGTVPRYSFTMLRFLVAQGQPMEAIESERKVTSWATSLEKLLNDTVGLHVFAVSILFNYS